MIEMVFISVLYEDVVVQGEWVHLPHVGHPVVVDPAARVHVDPQVASGVVGKQSLGVSKVDLDFPKPQKTIIFILSGRNNNNII